MIIRNNDATVLLQGKTKHPMYYENAAVVLKGTNRKLIKNCYVRLDKSPKGNLSRTTPYERSVEKTTKTQIT